MSIKSVAKFLWLSPLDTLLVNNHTNINMSNYRLLFIALLTFSITLVGCDSNDDSDDPEAAFEAMGEMMSSSFSALGFVAADIFINQAATKSQPTYSCMNEGTVEYNPSTTNPDLYTLDFQNCDGTNGTVDLGLSVEITQSTFNFSLLMDGSLQNQCSITFSNFTQNVISNASDETQSITLDGAYGATCNGQSYACTFNQVSLAISEEGDADYALFQDNCALAN